MTRGSVEINPKASGSWQTVGVEGSDYAGKSIMSTATVRPLCEHGAVRAHRCSIPTSIRTMINRGGFFDSDLRSAGIGSIEGITAITAVRKIICVAPN